VTPIIEDYLEEPTVPSKPKAITLPDQSPSLLTVGVSGRRDAAANSTPRKPFDANPFSRWISP
jgi:hypothetical protein